MMQNTKAYEERVKALALERDGGNDISGGSSFRQNPGYSDEVIMSDTRLAVEMVLRDQGLLQSNSYAVTAMLKQVEPPTKPRPEMNSQIQLA